MGLQRGVDLVLWLVVVVKSVVVKTALLYHCCMIRVHAEQDRCLISAMHSLSALLVCSSKVLQPDFYCAACCQLDSVCLPLSDTRCWGTHIQHLHHKCNKLMSNIHTYGTYAGLAVMLHEM